MSRLTRDGTAEPVSRDQILRHARGQGNIHFPCSADHEQDWQPDPVDPYSKMMEVIVEVCRAFGLTVSARKTETMCMPPPRTPRTMVRIEAAGQIYKQVQSFTYLGGAVTETPDMSVEIARRTSACWARIRRYSQELYGQPKVALSLKTRMVKAEAIEALLYGCST